MFVRFRQTKTRVQASLIATRRVDGKVRHEHVAMLGSVDVPPSVAKRFAFWQHLHERMAKLRNRVDVATQAKLLGAIHARIPMVTPDELRAEQLANAKAEAQVWDTIADLHAGTIEEHKDLIAIAERTTATAAAEHAKAAEQATRAKDRIARIERGEDVPGGLGKSMTHEDAVRILHAAGVSNADIAHWKQVSEVSDAFGRDVMVEELLDAARRAERNRLRALHRLIPDEGEN